jgi:hypothetical protein
VNAAANARNNDRERLPTIPTGGIMMPGGNAMRNGVLMLAAAVMFAPTGAIAQNSGGTTFKPVSPWALEYAEHTCRLIRNFSNGKAQITLAFERFGLGPSFELGLAGDGLRAFSRPRTIEYRFNHEASSRKGDVGKTVLADGRSSYHIRDVTLDAALKPTFDTETDDIRKPVDRAAELAVAERITSVSFLSGFASEPVIEMGPLRAPMQALHACNDDLLVSLKLDPVRIASISKVAMPAVGMEQWARSLSEGYPREMLRARAGGLVGLRLIISDEGAVESCLVGVEEQGPFEKAVCENALQMTFIPALDAAGEPIRSYLQTTVVYAISR